MVIPEILKENSGLFEPDIFPINVAIVALCVMLTLFSQLRYMIPNWTGCKQANMRLF